MGSLVHQAYGLSITVQEFDAGVAERGTGHDGSLVWKLGCLGGRAMVILVVRQLIRLEGGCLALVPMVLMLTCWRGVAEM